MLIEFLVKIQSIFKIHDEVKSEAKSHMMIFPSYVNHSDIARCYLSNDNIEITEAGFLCGKLVNNDTKINLFGNSATLGLSIDANNKHDDLNNYNWFAKIIDDDGKKEVVLYSTTDVVFSKGEAEVNDVVQCVPHSLYWKVDDADDADANNFGTYLERSYLVFDSKANNFDKENIVFLKTLF